SILTVVIVVAVATTVAVATDTSTSLPASLKKISTLSPAFGSMVPSVAIVAVSPEIVSTRPVMSAALAVQISAAKTTTAVQCFISLPNGRQERIGRMTWHLPRIEQILFQRRRAGDASRASLNSLKELVPENSRIECL